MLTYATTPLGRRRSPLLCPLLLLIRRLTQILNAVLVRIRFPALLLAFLASFFIMSLEGHQYAGLYLFIYTPAITSPSPATALVEDAHPFFFVVRFTKYVLTCTAHLR